MRKSEVIGLILFIVGMSVFTTLPFSSQYRLSEEQLRTAVKDIHRDQLAELMQPMYGQTYSSTHAFLTAYSSFFQPYNAELKAKEAWDQVIWDDYGFALAKAAMNGPSKTNPWASLGLSIGLIVLGGILYNLGGNSTSHDSLTHTGVFHSSLKNKGLLGLLTGSYLILFYVVLYWFPAYLAPLVWICLLYTSDAADE